MRIAKARLEGVPMLLVDTGSGFTQVAKLTWEEALEASVEGTLPDLVDGPTFADEELQFLAPISECGDRGAGRSRTSQIICIGRNYASHVKELGNSLPEFPTLFAKLHSSIIGPTDDIALPRESEEMDWEGELAIVIGRPARRVTSRQAASAIAGFTVANDITARDFQHRTSQWMQGKNFERTCPVGPWVTTIDQVGPNPSLQLRTTVDGVLRQEASTEQLIFDPPHLVAYISTLFTLMPGDLILTGTPAGVGFGLTPPTFLKPGQTVVTEIDRLGQLRNQTVSD